MNKVFVFPLPSSILLKKVTLPYHIFEERYRKMVNDSIATQTPIAVIHPNQFDSYENEICVAGIPHVMSSYPDGRLDIYITGAIKCRLADFVSEDPYFVYRYRPLEENLLVDESYSLELDSLRTILERWSLHFLPDPTQREAFSHTLEDPEVLINYCTVFLVETEEIKRAVMEATSLREKISLILQVVGPKEVSLGPFMPTLKF
jgi:Lon protease-like protein